MASAIDHCLQRLARLTNKPVPCGTGNECHKQTVVWIDVLAAFRANLVSSNKLVLDALSGIVYEDDS
jgi:hypothetical protein